MKSVFGFLAGVSLPLSFLAVAQAQSSNSIAFPVPSLSTNSIPVPSSSPPSAPNSAEAVLGRARQAILSAKTKPEDLDPMLKDIAAAAAESRQYYRPNLETLQSAQRFVREWQNYLIDKGSGGQRASNDLRNLSNQEGDFMPIPRSELLERAIKEEAVPGSAISGAPIELHTLDAIPAALAQIEARQRNGGFTNEMSQLQNALQNLNNAYQAYRNKNYSFALQNLGFNGFYSMVRGGGISPESNDKGSDLGKQLSALKDDLTLKIIQALLALPDAPAPSDGEKAADYLLRLAKTEEDAKDWTALSHVLEIYSQANNMISNSWLQEDLSGIHAYLVGEKLEAAGQPLDAIRSYRQALATLGKFFPAAPAAAKLDEMKSKYPDDYKEALQLPISRTP